MQDDAHPPRPAGRNARSPYPPLLVAQSPSEVHYYLQESTEDADSIACIVEVYAESAASPGPQFQEVTLEELHGMGYLTAAEQLALTPPADVSVVSPDAGFEARSWVSFWRDERNRERKWSYCGTVTKRPYRGQLFLDGDYKEYKNGQLYAQHPWPPKSSQLGDSLISAFMKAYINSDILHVVKGEHAFALPPEALIRTHAEGTY